ncbi:MAG: hypothetical protein IRZ05_03685 [Micromonosporaceae bacterium]|jgi:hypothetical protein|nr:hypothetical protein [Micromonosporaceae bacterium]
MATETRTDVRAANTQPQVRNEPGGQPMWRQEAQPMGRTEPQHTDRPWMGQRGGESKLSIKTSEFWIYLASVGAILIASQVIGTNANHSDYFRGDKAWFFIVLLTIGYLVSRGLAKAGSSTRGERR